MWKSDVIAHFKGIANTARAICVSYVAVRKWGPIVPKFSAEEIERITGGALKVIPELYVRGRPIPTDDIAVNH